jgi:hypothetical protein
MLNLNQAPEDLLFTGAYKQTKRKLHGNVSTSNTCGNPVKLQPELIQR